MERITKTSISSNVIELNTLNEDEILKIKNAYSVPDFIAKFLLQKKASGYLEDDMDNFLNPKIKHLMQDPFILKDMNSACDTFWHHFQRCSKVAVFGDYDVDGACAAALVKLFAIKIGFQEENFFVYIPNRMKEGYGPNKGAVKKLKDQGVELIITVDCGIVAFEAVEFAKSLGMSVIILDHHKGKSSLPCADAVVNPNRVDESGLEYLCGAGVVFLFCVALSRKFLNSNNDIRSFLFKNLDLVAMATVCDVVPLIKLNRAFVKRGLEIMATPGANIGIAALIKRVGAESPVSAKDLGFKIGPLINAGGRLGFSEYGVELLTCRSQERAERLAEEMFLFNKERIKIERETSKNAIELIENSSDRSIDEKIMFFYHEDWHEGIIGIVASRMQERYKKPAIVCCRVFGEDGEECVKASCRSSTLDIGGAVLKLVEDGVLLRGGGHCAAAGFSASFGKLQEVKDAFQVYAELKNQKDTQRIIIIDYVVSLESVGVAFLDEIGRLEPFGKQNEQPVFLINNLKVVSSEILSGSHVKVLLKSGNIFANAICFNSVGIVLGDFLINSVGKQIDIVCNIEENRWNGARKPSIVMIDVMESHLQWGPRLRPLASHA